MSRTDGAKSTLLEPGGMRERSKTQLSDLFEGRFGFGGTIFLNVCSKTSSLSSVPSLRAPPGWLLLARPAAGEPCPGAPPGRKVVDPCPVRGRPSLGRLCPSSARALVWLARWPSPRSAPRRARKPRNGRVKTGERARVHRARNGDSVVGVQIGRGSRKRREKSTVESGL
jgi:hypothetical protein